MRVRDRLVTLFLMASTLTAVTTTAAAAQTFRGTVVDDSTKHPLQSATLLLLDALGKELGAAVRSDSLGRFTLHAGSPGRYTVRVTRIGYAPLTSRTIEFVGGGIATLNFAMSAVQQKLGTIVVTEQRRLNRFELYSDLGFNLRRSKGQGKFLDTLDLQVYKRLELTTLLVEHAGLFVYRGLVMHNGLNPNGSIRTCQPELWIDGFPGSPWRLASMGADEVYGVEVYSNFQLPPASIGADFGSLQSAKPRTARCGVIAVWTKGYINEMKGKEVKRPPTKDTVRIRAMTGCV